jgi:hypothetical protein
MTTRALLEKLSTGLQPRLNMTIPRNRKPCKGFGKTALQKLHKRAQVRNAADGALFLDFRGLSEAEINHSIQVLNRLVGERLIDANTITAEALQAEIDNY